MSIDFNCKNMKKNWLLFLFLFCAANIFAQQKALTSSEILHGIQKLNTVGNALYLAAHPDDENTLLIAWLSKEKKVRTAYMAMTRGDGGQNLIGTEQGEYVGLLRTHELLEARKIDGGEQYFSRAVDFGFTKKTEEALLTWGKDKILADLVYQIRKFKPDVIINRFPPDERAGHGHHSASAILSAEAFDAAADPTKFPEQLKDLEVWQAKRLVWNSFSRGFNNIEPEIGSFIKLSLGDFNPLLGKSYPEIASEARSKHRSQGFGSAVSRNERYDFAIHIKGEPAKNDLFDGIDISWNRIKGGERIDLALKEIISNYEIQKPSSSVSGLIKVLDLIENLPNSIYKENKKTECLNLIMACAGLYFEANSASFSVSPGQKLKLFYTAIKRSQEEVKLNAIKINGAVVKDTIINSILTYNKALENSIEIPIALNTSITQPYWLMENAEKGFYKISDESKRGLPMAPDPLIATFEFEIKNIPLKFSTPIKYKYTEPSFGEIYRYLEIRPEVMVNFEEKVYVFTNQKPTSVVIIANSNIQNLNAKIKLELPTGWKVQPEFIDITSIEKNKEKKITFVVTPPANSSEIKMNVTASTPNGTFNRSLENIKYEHIPELNIFPLATAKAINLNIQKKGQNIGYIAGAGDEVPNALKQIGYTIINLNESNISSNLKSFDAIIVGVRAYNTEDWLVNSQDILLNYVKEGGNLIIQYQTQAFYGTVKTKDIGPYPLTIGRGRVTDENAEMKVLKPNHSILNYPNKIVPKDFEGWVQERGLYFADKYSDKYETIFSIKDEGEAEQEGSLLYTKYGKGNYIFTGLSFFRQLPAGVPGAYKLMSNLISIGK
jgi:LmbE family N-acetylglucosaminyl deacetylase